MVNSRSSDKVTRASYDQIALDYLDRHRNRTGYFKDFDTFSGLLKASTTVLDIGSGPGIEAARLKKMGFEVVCIDLSLSMLTVGVAEFAAMRVQADMRSLPISQAVGGIWAAASLHHLERQHVPNTLKEFSNTLVAGGILYLCVKQGVGSKWDSRYGESAPRFFTFWDLDDLVQLLHEAGFEIVKKQTSRPEAETWISLWARKTSHARPRS